MTAVVNATPTRAEPRGSRGSRPPRRAAAIAVALAAGALSAPVVLELIEVWMAVPYYTHAFLVPVFSAWLLLDLREAATSHPSERRPAPAIAAFLLGLGVLVLGTWTASLPLRALALPGLAFAAGLALLPGATPRRLLFPIGFLLLVTPLPDGALAELSLVLQRLAAAVTAGVLATGGIPYTQAGLFIHLESVTLHVSEACNGLRFLLAMLTTGVAFAGLAVTGVGTRATVVALAVAIAILANLVRVASTALIAYSWGADAASGLAHIVYGKVVYAVALAAFLAIVLTLRRRARRAAGDPPIGLPGITARPPGPARGAPAPATGRND